MVRFQHHPQSLLAGAGLDGLFRVAENLHAQMNQAPAEGSASALRAFAPKAELTASEDGAKLVMLVPGFGPEHLELSVERASVTVKGERADSPAATGFERTFRLPFPVDADQAVATVELGILSLELPRLAADKPRRIQIQGRATLETPGETAAIDADTSNEGAN